MLFEFIELGLVNVYFENFGVDNSSKSKEVSIWNGYFIAG